MSQILKDVEKAIEADSTDLLDECLRKYSVEDFQNMNKLSNLSVTHLACSRRKLNCISFLAVKGQSLAWILEEFGEKAPGGSTSLHYVMKGYPRPGKEAKSGKNKRAKRRQKEEEEFLPKFTEILQIFKKNNISLNLTNAEGFTVLQLMVQTEKYQAAVRKLIQHGAEVTMIDKDHNNLLHLCARTGLDDAWKNILSCLDRDTQILLLEQINKQNDKPIDTLKNSAAPKEVKERYGNYLPSLIEAKRVNEERRALLKKRDPPRGSCDRGTKHKKSKLGMDSGGSRRSAAPFPPKLDGSSAALSPHQLDAEHDEQIQTEPNSTV